MWVTIHEKKEEKRRPSKKKRGQDNIPLLLYKESEGKKEESQNPNRGNQLKRGSLT